MQIDLSFISDVLNSVIDTLRGRVEVIGALPIINHFIDRLGLDQLLDKHVPSDSRCELSHAQSLGILIRSLITRREPFYNLSEWIKDFAPSLFRLKDNDIAHFNDDRLGRALDQLFDADRNALLTDVALAVADEFGVRFDEFHNDSTSVSFFGNYSKASGRKIRGQCAPKVTQGLSKDHRPDLKQIVLILTTSADGNVPIVFRCADGNTNDSPTHIHSWDMLRKLVGHSSFLYVADSKLCSRENMLHIDQEGGTFVTIMPRNRLEDIEFRQWVQTNEPKWQDIKKTEDQDFRTDKDNCYRVYRSEKPSSESWPVTWVFNSKLAKQLESNRKEKIDAAVKELLLFRNKLNSGKYKAKSSDEVEKKYQSTLEKYNVKSYFKVYLKDTQKEQVKQIGKGRPGVDTKFATIILHDYNIEWTIDQEAIDKDHKSDGMFPLLSNNKNMTPEDVFMAYKRQPKIEKRFSQLKSVLAITPVLLKNEGRIEAFFTLFFLALLVSSLIEREIRQSMKKNNIKSVNIYPENKPCKTPTTEVIIRYFSKINRINFQFWQSYIKDSDIEFDKNQIKVLGLLGIPVEKFSDLSFKFRGSP